MSWSPVEYQAYLIRRHAGRPPTSKRNGEHEPEHTLHDGILSDCRRRGWIAFHGSMAHRTRRIKGEPDFCVLADRGRVFFVEVKSKGGKLSKPQREILALAKHLGHQVHLVKSIGDWFTLTR